MPLSKKYYNGIVKVLCATEASAKTIDGFVDYLSGDNAKFSEVRFRAAIRKCKR